MDQCAGCEALRSEYLNDQGILEPYWQEQMVWTAEHLMIRGWAGGNTDAEKLFLDHHPPPWRASAQAKMVQLASLTTAQEKSDAFRRMRDTVALRKQNDVLSATTEASA